MSEYVTVEARPTSNPDVIEIVTNMTLTELDAEIYADFEAGDQGSTIAQMLFNGVEGIAALTISRHALTITRADSDISWEALIDDVRDALRDFFL
jgi:hypothetical protein